MNRSPLLLLLSVACSSDWKPVDIDGDGLSSAEGDCWESSEAPVPPEGALDHGLSASDIGPGVEDLPYDGIDQDCSGDDDFDQDGDGMVPLSYAGIGTLGVEGSGALPAGDCWDLPEGPGDTEAHGLSGADIFLGAEEVHYDGIDQDCGGDDDYDQDGDGYVPDSYEGLLTYGVDGSGALPAGDCLDGAAEGAWTGWEGGGESVHPGAPDEWYDGYDSDCGGDDDYDQDGDGYASAADPGPDGGDDCNDLDPDLFPTGGPEIPYNGLDDNCDAADGDGDADGDGSWLEGYLGLGLEIDSSVVLPESYGDCWDDPSLDPASIGMDSLLEAQPLAAEVHPGAADAPYDGVDQDCSGEGSDFDADGDGEDTVHFSQRDGSTGTDCVDREADPGFLAAVGIAPAEIGSGQPSDAWYDGVDQDCGGNSDYDQDGDGYDSDSELQPDGSLGGDCDDLDPGFSPSVQEVCDAGLDNDCDGLSDDADPSAELSTGTVFYLDADGDGYGDIASPSFFCALPVGYAEGDGDCDDADALARPDLASAEADPSLCMRDADQDGYGDADADGSVEPGTDCDDSLDAVNPGAAEPPADGVDQDCDGLEICYEDADVDGQGAAELLSDDLSCSAAGVSGLATDCDDGDDTTYFGAAAEAPSQCMRDSDGDGFGDAASSGPVVPGSDCDDESASTYPGAATEDPLQCMQDADGDGFGDASGTGPAVPGTDCDDADPAVSPSAEEGIADGIDQDCDGEESCYLDLDLDGYGTASIGPSADLGCSLPGVSVFSDDCDDLSGDIFPTAEEGIADGVDQNCDGEESCYADLDLDGFGTSATVLSPALDCSLPGVSVFSDDCDDLSEDVSPSAEEGAADGVDQNCDGEESCYVDLDLDGYGTAATGLSSDFTCSLPGYSPNVIDCDDEDADISPIADEGVADGVDQNCDGEESCYTDLDLDGYGSTELSNSPDLGCGLPGVSALPNDCDDSEEGISPSADELSADGVDQDCDGEESCHEDLDLDGYGTEVLVGSADLTCLSPGLSSDPSDCEDGDPSVNPGAGEQPADAFDQNCDGAESCFSDGDLDGYGTLSEELSPDLSCSLAGISPLSSDCDDVSPEIFPLAEEISADGTDQNCDGLESCYLDDDLDGYGGLGTGDSSNKTCTEAGFSPFASDCDDGDSLVSPGASEFPADAFDQNCNGEEDCYEDSDGDGSGGSSLVSSADLACLSAGSSPEDGDCDDTDASIGPFATELPADGVDQNCDGLGLCYLDDDLDGYGGEFTVETGDEACLGPNESGTGSDCDDSSDTVSPDGVEDCTDGFPDNDCSSQTLCLDDGLDDAESGYAVYGTGINQKSGSDLALCGFSGGDALLSGETSSNDGYGGAHLLSFPGSEATTDGAEYTWVSTSEDLGFGTSVDCGDIVGGGEPDIAIAGSGSSGQGVYIFDGEDLSPGMEESEAGYFVELEPSGVVASRTLLRDLTGDGDADLLVSAHRQSKGLLFVADGDLMGSGIVLSSSSTNGYYILEGESNGDQTGISFDAGDIDGDGLDDLAIGAPKYKSGDKGMVYLQLGPVGENLSLRHSAFRIEGDQNDDFLGSRVHLGDFDGDGHVEVAMGASQQDRTGSDSAGKVFLFDIDTYSDGGLGFSDAYPGSKTSVSSLAGTVIQGVESRDLVSAAIETIESPSAALAVAAGDYGTGRDGALAVFSADTLALGPTILYSPDEADFFVWGVDDPGGAGGRFGHDLLNAGNLDGDLSGSDDLVVGGSLVNRPGLNNAGALYILYGPF
jgi:hypothetical protein